MDEPTVLRPGGIGSPAPARETRATGERPPTRVGRDEARVVQVAGFWRRGTAALIDAVLVGPAAWLLALAAVHVAGLDWPHARHAGPDYWLDLALAGEPALVGAIGLALAIAVVYLLVFQITQARTVGMRLMALRIIDLYGDPPGALRAVARTAGYLVALATLALGFVWIAFDREKRGLHDWLAGTYVIRDAERR